VTADDDVTVIDHVAHQLNAGQSTIAVGNPADMNRRQQTQHVAAADRPEPVSGVGVRLSLFQPIAGRERAGRGLHATKYAPLNRPPETAIGDQTPLSTLVSLPESCSVRGGAVRGLVGHDRWHPAEGGAGRDGQRSEQVLLATGGLIGEFPAADDGEPRLPRVEHVAAETSGTGQFFQVRVGVGEPLDTGRGVQQGQDTTRDPDGAEARAGQPPRAWARRY